MEVRLPRRAVAFSIGGWLAGAVVLLLLHAVLLAVWSGQQARARTPATGSIRSLTLGSGDDISRVEVVWSDADGGQRWTEFPAATQDGWRKGAPFTLRYDPDVTDSLEEFALPTGADADRVVAPGPPGWLWVPALIGALGAAGTALPWRTRSRRAAAAAAAEPEPVRLVPLLERHFAFSQRPDHIAVALLPADAPEPDAGAGLPADLPAGTRVQWVAWRETFGQLPSQGLLGTARIGGPSRPSAVLQPADRDPLFPLGPLREFRPGRYWFSHRHAVRRSEHAPHPMLWVGFLAGLAVGYIRLGLTAGRPDVSDDFTADLALLPPTVVAGLAGLLLMDWGWRGGLPRSLPKI
jgi:hypothetical protein